MLQAAQNGSILAPVSPKGHGGGTAYRLVLLLYALNPPA